MYKRQSLRLERRSCRQTTAACTSSATLLVTGTRALSAAPLSYVIIQASGACASGAALLGLDTGARAPSAPPSATRLTVVKLLRLHVAPFGESVLLLHLPTTWWRSV